MKWGGRKVLQQVTVFKNMSSPLILGINGVDKLDSLEEEVTNLDLKRNQTQKHLRADLKVIS